jgi:hypothetical protein
MNHVKIAVETLTPELMLESEPLQAEHWKEVATFKNAIKLSVDTQKYIMAQERGKLMCLVARDGKAMVGYAIFFIDGGMNYQDTLFGLCQVIYVLPRYRGLGALMIATAENELRILGVKKMIMRAKVDTTFPAKLEHLGFKPENIELVKML